MTLLSKEASGLSRKVHGQLIFKGDDPTQGQR